MSQLIKDVMETDFPVVDCDETVAEAEAKLADCGFDALPVLNPDRSVFGMLGTADVIRFHRGGGNHLAIHAWEICATRPTSLRFDAGLDDAMALYSECSFRQLVVNDDQGRLAGLLTAEDLLHRYLVADAHIPANDEIEAVPAAMLLRSVAHE